jgi:hypothetical protein
MRLIRVTAPSGDVVSLADLKVQLGGLDDSEDGALTAYLAATTAWIDAQTGWFGRALLPQTWELTRHSFFHETREGVHHGYACCRHRRHGEHDIELPFPPLISVDSVAYVDPANVSHTLDASAYEVQGVGARGLIMPTFGAFWPATTWRKDAVTIRFTCGYPPSGSPAVSTVPAPVKQAIVLATSKLRSLAMSDPSLKMDTVIGVSSQQWDIAGIKMYDAAIDALLAPYRVFV